MTDEELMWLGIPLLVISIIANSILNVDSGGKQGWGRSGNFVFFCLMLFTGCLVIGWKLYGLLGAAGAIAAQIAGMVIGISLLKGRTSKRKE